MSVDFSNSRLPGPPAEWIAFLAAVGAATPEDETDALEFKSSCDLTDHQEVAKSIARTILAMANRNPDAAQREYGGAGLLVVGAQPGATSGVTKVDPTSLGAIVATYVGSGDGAPIWHMQYWDVDSTTTVLMIDVHPPRWGDPTFALLKGWGNTSRGTVFIRRNASSEQASQAEMAMLARREHTKPGDQNLPVLVIGGAEVLPSVRVDHAHVERWVTGNVTQLLDSISAPPAPPPSAPRMSGLTGTPFVVSHKQMPEERSEEEFRAEVDEYERQVRDAIAALPLSLGAHLVPAPELLLQNESNRYFAELEVDFHLPPGVLAVEAPEGSVNVGRLLPRRPRRFGPWWKRTSSTAGLLADFPHEVLTGYKVPIVPIAQGPYGTEIENDGRGPIVSRVRELRSNKSRPIASDTVFLVPDSYGSSVTIEWSATAKEVDAEAKGDITFTLDDSIDLFEQVMDYYRNANAVA